MFKSLHSSALMRRHARITEQVVELHEDISLAIQQVDESVSKLNEERTELAKLQGLV